MRDRDYYPAGAYNDPNAPFNEPSAPDPIDINVMAVLRVSHETTVSTDNYNETWDEEGYRERELFDKNSDIERLYNEQHKTIPQLLDELANYINGELLSDGLSRSRRQELQDMLADCKGWTVEEVEIDDYDY